LHDTGTLDRQEVVDVFKQGAVAVHVLKEKPNFKVGDTVASKIDFERRKQLAQHHTATHIVNAAARKILGRHINQAGAKKTEEKAHLDITHYQLLSEEELKEINEEANRLVKKDLQVKSSFLTRNEAEKKYGMSIYQGGAVPGKSIRIIEIEGVDVEACGGTHLHKTSEVGEIRILKAGKIQDGIIRLTFTAGKAAQKSEVEKSDVLNEVTKLLNVKPELVPARAQELFEKWKKANKLVKKGQKLKPEEYELNSKEKYEGDVLARTAEILRTQPQFIANTIRRFLKELEELKDK
jgi:alanyl-tRNA synthetase